MSLRLKLDPFIPALMAIVGLAVVWPDPGVSGGPLHADVLATYGIAVIFFLYGLTLAPEHLLQSAGHWRVHLVVQLATFVLFPALVLLSLPLLEGVFPREVLLGLFFLAALPSTVSSSVAMTSLARGNVPVAIFNASISSLLGVFITPLLMAWYLHATGSSLPLEDVILKLLVMVVLPLVVGQAARPLVRDLVARHKRVVRFADRAVILIIVYNSFCDSVAEGVWRGQDVSVLAEMAAYVIALFFAVYGLVGGVCRLMGLSVADRIATQFCASKKSLATGLPMAGVIFGATAQLSFVIAPLMMFHFLQLVIVSFLAAGFAARPEEAPPASAPLAPEGPSVAPSKAPQIPGAASVAPATAGGGARSSADLAEVANM